MFDVRAVTRRVNGRLAALRNVREEEIHDAYRAEMRAELEGARREALRLAAFLTTKVQAVHPERKWVMLAKEDVDRVNELFDKFAKEVT